MDAQGEVQQMEALKYPRQAAGHRNGAWDPQSRVTYSGEQQLRLLAKVIIILSNAVLLL